MASAQEKEGRMAKQGLGEFQGSPADRTEACDERQKRVLERGALSASFKPKAIGVRCRVPALSQKRSKKTIKGVKKRESLQSPPNRAKRSRIWRGMPPKRPMRGDGGTW